MRRFKLLAGVLVTLIIILAIPTGLTNSAKGFYLKSSKPFMTVLYGATQWLLNIAGASHIAQENRELKQEIDLLKKHVFQDKEMELENVRLREFLLFRERTTYGRHNTVATQVIGRTPAGWRKTILLSKGRDDGVEDNMPVITEAGLVGKISETDALTSKVKLITHPQFRVGAILQKGRHTGVVYGTIDGECRMKYIALDADVQIGDHVETAGFSEFFPKGILIGSIDAVWKEPGQIYKVASIHLSADINRLEEVLCIRNVQK